MKKIIFFTALLLNQYIYSQNTDEFSSFIKSVYNEALPNGKAYEWLDYLSNQIGGRLSGSVNYDRSVTWGKEQLSLINLDSVWLQPVMVPKWVKIGRAHV